MTEQHVIHGAQAKAEELSSNMTKKIYPPVMDGFKRCIKCGEEKHVTLFHKHPQMKSGRLNKCAACVREYVKKWVEENPGVRARQYAKNEGAKKRARGLRRRLDGEGYDPLKRKISALKYSHKRKAQKIGMPVWDADFDEFVMDEAKRLAEDRTAITGHKWSVDHIVPINHRLACGLHNGHNLNVVPASWNSSKSNRNIGRFFGA